MKLKQTLLYGFSILSLTCLSAAQDAPKGPPPEGGPPGAPPPGGPQGGPPRGAPQGGLPGGGDPSERIAAFIKNADTDNDGKISKDEFINMSKKGSEERFGHMDANSDGFVDKEEVAKMAQAGGRGGPGQGGQGGQGMRRPEGGGSPGGEGGGFRRPPGAEGGPPGSPGGQPQGQGMRPGGEGGPRGGGMFGDPKEGFKRMDADGNGSVSEDEFIKATEKMREMMRNRGGQGGPGMNRPGEGGAPGAPGGRGGEGGFRRPPVEGDAPKGPAPEKPKDPA